MIIQPQQFETYSLIHSIIGNEICKVLAAAINGADAGEAIFRTVSRENDRLIINKSIYQLAAFKRVFIIGVGKAVIPMAEAVCKILADKITKGFLITPENDRHRELYNLPSSVKVVQARHPIPAQQNIEAGLQLSSLVDEYTQDDLVLFLLSGGGSALLMKPMPGLSLDAIQVTTALLLKSGAPITEINTIRKHLDFYKGGGLAKILFPATLIALILSDVMGDALDVIASGPTVPDPSTYKDAWNIITKYQIVDFLPKQVIAHLSNGLLGKIPETSKQADTLFKNVSNIIVGNNGIAISSALKIAQELGFSINLLTTPLQGEASVTGKEIAEEAISLLHRSPKIKKPVCFITGGETTVTLHGCGIGGRNQELVLGAVPVIFSTQHLVFVSLATDGVDGPTDAAGAVATNETYSRGLNMDIFPRTFLRENNSYQYFLLLEDLIKTGPTLTNVNDLVMVFAA